MSKDIPILLIDDDSVFAKVVARMLMVRGYQPILCGSIEDAVKFANKVTIALTDVELPGMDGIAGCKALRAANPNIKIIVMSGSWKSGSFEEAITESRAQGASWFLKKPFQGDALNEALASITDGRVQASGGSERPTKYALDILIADDDPLFAKILMRQLSQQNDGSINHVESGDKVLERLKSGDAPDLLILDLNMPGTDGVALLRELSELDFDRGIWMISGEDRQILRSAERLATSYQLKVIGTGSKPVAPETIATTLERATATLGTGRNPIAVSIEPQELRRAIREGVLENHYQPKILTSTRQLVGAETLIRWRHPDLGLMYPNAFIPFAEQHGLIDLLTDAMVLQAVEALGRWREEGLDLRLSVNLSSSSLPRKDFPDVLSRLTTKARVPNDRVVVEVTESGVASDTATGLEALIRLRLQGFGLSIDDFGTGNSSLSRLDEAPFSELKIDRSFVAGAANDSDKEAIFNASIQIAKKLGLSTVAEGVETSEDWSFVKQRGADEVQGYLVAKPMPAEEFREWIEDWKPGARRL